MLEGTSVAEYFLSALIVVLGNTLEYIML